MSDWIFVAEAASIQPGHYETADLDGTLAAVFNVNGEFYAIEDVCTHDGTVLTSGNPIEGDEIVCPRHGARFCVRTGEALSAPAYEPTATFPVKGVIPGWTEALQLMKEGSKWMLVIPSSLAYAERGAGNMIGPNSTLVFEVELLSIKKP